MATRMHKLQFVLLAWDGGYRGLGRGAREWAFELGLRRVRLTKQRAFYAERKTQAKIWKLSMGMALGSWGSAPPMPSPPWSTHLYGSVKPHRAWQLVFHLHFLESQPFLRGLRGAHGSFHSVLQGLPSGPA